VFERENGVEWGGFVI